MTILKRLRNIWKLGEIDIPYSSDNEQMQFNVIPKQEYKPAQIIKLNKEDPIEKVLKKEE